MSNTVIKKPLYGVLCALGAFMFWGFIPLYWRELAHIPATEILGQRIFWGALVLGSFIFIRDKSVFLAKIKNEGIKSLLLSGVLIFANWFLFVWAVSNGSLIDASLGYFLTPLLNILMGHFLFNEPLGNFKKIALFCASLGVLFLFFLESGKPLVSLSLAGTFTVYSYLKKKSNFSGEHALAVEMFIFFIPVVAYFIFLQSQQEFFFFKSSALTQFLIFLCGIVTIIPLWLFNTAVKHIDLGTIGFFQFLAPSVQLILGIFVFHENFDMNRLGAFVMIWLGVLFYLIEVLKTRQMEKV